MPTYARTPFPRLQTHPLILSSTPGLWPSHVRAFHWGCVLFLLLCYLEGTFCPALATTPGRPVLIPHRPGRPSQCPVSLQPDTCSQVIIQCVGHLFAVFSPDRPQRAKRARATPASFIIMDPALHTRLAQNQA
jgi:hypothetical protein